MSKPNAVAALLIAASLIAALPRTAEAATGVRFGNLLSSVSSARGASETLCNSSQVSTSVKGQIFVAPNGMDDTDNLQCAIDLAIESGNSQVTLGAGDFWFSDEILIDGFQGKIQGAGLSKTRLITEPQAFNCRIDGDFTAGFRMIRSDVNFADLSLIADDPCDPANASNLFIGLFFTVPNEQCDDRAMDSGIYRVGLELSDAIADGNYYGLAVSDYNACNSVVNQPTGAFRIASSRIEGWSRGAQLSMVESAMVDIINSEFYANLRAVSVSDADQILTINGNDFHIGYDAEGTTPIGITVNTLSGDAPVSNRITVSDNRFYDETLEGMDYPVYLYNVKVRAALQASITGNHFEGKASTGGADPADIVATDIDFGYISANTFAGEGDRNIDISSTRFNETVTGWSVMNNNFEADLGSEANIYFGANTADNVVGPGQGSTVIDDGDNTNNDN